MSLKLKDQIEDYLHGRLSSEKLEVFEKALANDQELRDEVSFRKLTIKGTQQSVRHELKGRLKRIQAEYEDKNQSKTQKNKTLAWPKWIGIAASVLFLITAGFFFFNDVDHNPQTVFHEYYQAAPLYLAQRGNNEENQILQLNEFYSNKEYDKALPFFQKQLSIDQNNSRLRLGAGICHLELDQLESAKDQFLTIIEAKDFRLQHQANWYIALTFLKEGDFDNVQKYLKPILNDSKADHQEDAIELTKRLNNM